MAAFPGTDVQDRPTAFWDLTSVPRNEGSGTTKVLCHAVTRPSAWQTRGEGRGRRGRAASARCAKSQAVHTVAATGTGRGGGAVCEARVVMGPSPRWRCGRHAHAAVVSHATAVTPRRTTRTESTGKRQSCVPTVPSLVRHLFGTLPSSLASLAVLGGSHGDPAAPAL
jgi:hypothetical protein